MAEEAQEAPLALMEAPTAKKDDAPAGLPGWIATFSDLVTLLLTFFVLLLSFAKTETSKYEAALGSIRNAFGGNVLQEGEVRNQGKSPDDSLTLMDSQEPARPFPIEFLTTEGFLNRHEINRESTEDLNIMSRDLHEFNLLENVDIYEMKEGIKVVVRDKITFKKGSIVPDKVVVSVYDRLVQLLSKKNWVLFVIGHASLGEVSEDGILDALGLSAQRASAVTKSLVKRGIRASKVTTVFHGDSRPLKVGTESAKVNDQLSRRVEFIIRKNDLSTLGTKKRAKSL